MGMASGASEQGAVWAGNRDNVGTTNVSRINKTTKCIINGTESGSSPTVDGEADLDSFDSDGFTLDWTTVDSTAREFIYLAMGSDAVASSGRIMSSLAHNGGLAGYGGIAGHGGGLAG